ncbi:uncharacterized protein LAESUDRAFT_345539 [Laetiporus sulphureus 93-53]|uniref:Uncharacterized protein n=1 Tax=Laetiporus sulphureus 93-53 TaxID=1314785 RepID=A0A165GR64_9APHY|nr:uncharacterized protein LAESUDRAFT_345539 [Laetiporus sulphureus 93-53]KZT10693.1 hypothetical protein LAESUDRAFT_345539 [Laetiporus sulphureus 93-53]
MHNGGNNHRTFKTATSSVPPSSTSSSLLSLPIRSRKIVHVEFEKDKNLELDLPLDHYLYIPSAEDNLSFDSSFVEYRDTDDAVTATIWIFQMTVSTGHHGASAGYELVSSVEDFVRQQTQERTRSGPQEIRDIERRMSEEVGSIAGRKRKRKRSLPASVVSRKKPKRAKEAVMKSNYVLICPDKPAEARTWTMPDGWRDDKGLVYCQLIPISY